MTPPLTRVLERTGPSPENGGPAYPLGPGIIPYPGMVQIPVRRLAAATRAVLRREWLAAFFALSAIFALVNALISFNPAERLWGELAAVSYCAAAVAAAVVRRRGASLALLIGLIGALLAPLAWMASTHLAQPEVGVIVRSAKMLVDWGTPYLNPAALAAAHSWRAYDPYLPALIAFGVPRALAGGVLTDPRVWFGAAFLITFGAAVRVAGVPRPAWWTGLVIASPVVALPMAVGGDDLPVLGLICLGLALAGRAVHIMRAPAAPAAPGDSTPGDSTPGSSRPGCGGRAAAGPCDGGPGPGVLDRAAGRLRMPPGWRCVAAAGVAIGLAAAMKATAWPGLAVVLLLIAASGGRRAASLFGAAVAGVVLITDGPAVAVQPAATMTNTVLYPLGLAKAASPAASGLPGHMLASAGTWGRLTALTLMLAAGAAVAAWLILRPPKSAQAVGWRLVIGLTLLFGLAPASRVGYFVYPLGIAAWLLLSLLAERFPAVIAGVPGPGDDPATASLRQPA